MTLRIFVRITWLLVVLGGAALFVAVERFDLIKLQEAQCYLSDSAATAPIDKFVQTYLGRSILAFPSDKYLESIFADNPQLERAELRKHYDGRLTIALRVKKPVLLVSLDQIYGLTSRGELIPAGLTDLPIVTGLQISAPILYTFAYSEASAYALKIAALLANDTTGLKDYLTLINLDHPSGLSVFIEGCAAELILGRGDEARCLNLVSQLRDFLVCLDEQITSVDLRFKNQLVLKKTI